MPRISKNAVKHIVSFRVNDLEREVLEELASEFDMNISTLLRKSLELLEKAYMDGEVRGEFPKKPFNSPDA